MKKTLAFILTLILLSPAFRPSFAANPAPAKRKAFLISHFHYDPIWTNSQAGETLRAFSIIHQQLEYADQEPNFRFLLSEVDYLKPYWDAYPMDRERLLKLAKEGRVEFTGGYNEPDESEIGAEALLRNFVYGKRYKEAQFGSRVLTAAQHDVFGHTPQLPQMLLAAGYKYAIFTRGNDFDLPTEFNWLSPDGSSVLTKLIAYNNNAGAASFRALESKYYALSNNGMFISGGDFEQPDRGIGARTRKKEKSVEFVSGTLIDYFEAVEKSLKESGRIAPEISRDQSPVFNGCYTSRHDTKQANRLVENLLVDAEKFATIRGALLPGTSYPWRELDRAWRLLFFGQHHDALPGSNNENTNLDLLTGWREAASISKRERDATVKGIADWIDTRGGTGRRKAIAAIAVFNSLNWARTEPVSVNVRFPKRVKAFRLVDATGKPVVFQITSGEEKKGYESVRLLVTPPAVPSAGYRALYVVAAAKFTAGVLPKTDKAEALENEYYRIEVDPARGGGIKSLYSKKLKKEFINASVGLGNEIFAIQESAGSSPWGLSASGKFLRTGDYPAKYVAIEHGAVCDRLFALSGRHGIKEKKTVRHTLPALITEIRLCRGNPRIDFTTYMLDFKEKDILFKVGFPADLPGAAPMFEERMSVVARNRNERKFLELPDVGPDSGREYSLHNWLGLSPSTAISFSDARGVVSEFPLTTGEIIIPDGDEEALAAANKLSAALVESAVTTAPTSDKINRNNTYYGFRVSLGYAHRNRYTEKLLDAVPERRGRLKADIDRDGFGALFVEAAESVKSNKVPIPILIVEAASIEKLNEAMEKIGGGLGRVQKIELPDAANRTSFKSRMDAFGLALLSNGLSGGSVEDNGTITLSLMRSSTGHPSGAVYSDNWEIENWNHVFHYALLPHGGDWSSARVPREGYAFNFPLIAVQTGIHGGGLSGDAVSFVDTGNADVILSALKPAGDPVANGIGDISGTNLISTRWFNPGDSSVGGDMRLNLPVTEVLASDSLDAKGKPLTAAGGAYAISFSPFRIQSYLAKIGTGKFSKAFPPAPAKKNAAAVPVYARYWETNDNVAPEGFAPVAVVLEPNGYSADFKSMNLRVTVAGNLKDRGVAGALKFSLPKGAKVKGATNVDLAPMGVKTMDFRVEGLNPARLSRQYISVAFAYDGVEYEDVLTFSDWKVSRDDAVSAADPATDDSGWAAAPLARFWADAGNSSVAWYRRKYFVPKGVEDYQATFERASDAKIEMYINGNLVRKEAFGVSYTPLLEKKLIKPGEDNLVAIRHEKGKADAPAWGTAFRGSEALFNRESCSLPERTVAIAAGAKGTLRAEITNPFDQELAGEAVLVSPIETWAESGAYSMVEFSPMRRTFRTGPGEKVAVDFSVSAPKGAVPGPYVAAVKFIYKGILCYTDTARITVK